MLPLVSCATIRVTDPTRTATEEYLENVATAQAVDQLSTNVLRDRKVYIDSIYLGAATQPSDEHQYLLGEVRSKLLLSGVRLRDRKDDAEIVLEVRSQGVSVDRVDFLLGLSSANIGGLFTSGVSTATPELSILKYTKQLGFSSVAYVAYWTDTGEVVASSGPFIGRTLRNDTWFFGYGPRTTGNIPPAQPAPQTDTGPAATRPTKPKKQNPQPKATTPPDASKADLPPPRDSEGRL